MRPRPPPSSGHGATSPDRSACPASSNSLRVVPLDGRIVPCPPPSDKRSRRHETSTQRNPSSLAPISLTGRPTPASIRRMNRKSDRPAIQLDEVSKAIIEQLQQDGRRSYAAIGKVVGLSEAAVRQRVQRLIDSGVMQ